MDKKTSQLTRAICADHVRAFAEKQIAINAAEAAMNAELVAVKERYENEIVSLKNEQKIHAKKIELWAMENPQEFDNDRKSIEFLCGTIGHRTGNPSVATIGGWTLARALKVVISRGMRDFVAVKESLSKEAILAAYREKKIDAGTLRTLGLEIRSAEKFFIEPNLEEVSHAH